MDIVLYLFGTMNFSRIDISVLLKNSKLKFPIKKIAHRTSAHFVFLTNELSAFVDTGLAVLSAAAATAPAPSFCFDFT
jgi:hypothetical protein